MKKISATSNEKLKFNCQAFAKLVFSQKIVSYYSFFSAIDKFIERGIDPTLKKKKKKKNLFFTLFKNSEIHYQISHSKSAFDKLNKKNGLDSVKKLIFLIHKDKYVKKYGSDPNLFQLVWGVFQEFSINQFKNYEKMTEKCYPGQHLSVTASDLKSKIFPLIK